jgi:hypothetical protein
MTDPSIFQGACAAVFSRQRSDVIPITIGPNLGPYPASSMPANQYVIEHPLRFWKGDEWLLWNPPRELDQQAKAIAV